MAKSSPLQVRLPDDLKAAAAAKAERDGVSLSAVVRDAIAAAVTSPCERCGGSGVEPD